MDEVSLVKLPSDECHWTLLMRSQHWFRWWLGTVRQQAITWANVDPDLCCHMASPGHSELTHWPLEDVVIILIVQYSRTFSWLISRIFSVKLPGECHWTSLISPYCSGDGLVISGTKPLIIWTSLDQNPRCHMPLLGYISMYNGLTPFIDGLVQDCSKSIANALELPQSCAKPSIYWIHIII